MHLFHCFLHFLTHFYDGFVAVPSGVVSNYPFCGEALPCGWSSEFHLLVMRPLGEYLFWKASVHILVYLSSWAAKGVPATGGLGWPKMAFVVPEFPEDLYVPMLNLDPSTKGYFYVLLGDLHFTTPLQPQFIMLTGTDLWDLLARGPPLVFRATRPFYAAPPFVHQLLCFRGQN